MKNARYNKSEIMRKAWVIFRNQDVTWSDALKQSWNIAKNGVAVLNFDKVYKDNYSKIYNFVKLRVNSIEITEELTQDIFLKLHQNFDKYNVYLAKLNTWLYTIARNTVIDYYRTNKYNQNCISASDFINDDEIEISNNIFISDDTAESNLQADELNDKISKSFESLTPKHQEISILYFIDEKSYKEIAEILSVPMGTVTGMLHRSRKQLQKSLIMQKVRV